jgi:membrane-associated phospholipid phosphatase
VLGLTSAALAVVAWASTTQTLVGQQLADAILYGRATADVGVVDAATETLAVASLTSAAMVGLGLAAFALARGGFRLAGAAVAMLAGANLTSLALKGTLERPDLLGGSAYATGNSFPSGTVTLAASIAFAAILVAPRRVRTLTAIGGATVTAVVGVSAIIAGWHRLADVVGAVLVALAWASLLAGLLVLTQGWMPRRTWSSGVGGRTGSIVAVTGAAAVVAGAIGIVMVVADRPHLSELIAARATAPGPFIAALAIVVGTSLIACAGYVVAMRGVAFERRG